MAKTFETAIKISAYLDSQFKPSMFSATAALQRVLLKERELKAELKATTEEIRRSGVATADLATKQRNLDAALAGSARKASALAAAMNLKKTLLGDSSQGPLLQKMGTQIRGIAGDAAKLGVGLAAAATVPLVQFAKFESGMAEVATLVDTSKVSIPELAKGVRALAQEYGADHVNSAKALYSVISSGVSDSAQAMDVLRIANKLAVGGATDVATAVTGLTSSVNAYAAAQLTATEAADAFFVASAIGQATPEALSQSIGNIAPTAVSAGVSFNDLTAAIGAITTVIPSTSEAVSGLRGVLTAVLDPSNEAKREAKRLGIEFSATALKTMGLQKFIGQLATNSKFGAESAAQLFGRVEAGNAIMALAGNNMKTFNDAVETMSHKTGAADGAFKKMQQTTAFQWSRMKAQANDAMIMIGGALAPAVGRAMSSISGWVTANQDKIKQWGETFALWVEGKAVPAVQKFVPEVLRLAEKIGALIGWAAKLTGGFDNLALVMLGLRFAPLAASVVQLGSSVAGVIPTIARYVAGLWKAEAAAKALSAAQGGGAGAGGAVRAIPVAAAAVGVTAATIGASDLAQRKLAERGVGTGGQVAGSALASSAVAGALFPLAAPLAAGFGALRASLRSSNTPKIGEVNFNITVPGGSDADVAKVKKAVEDPTAIKRFKALLDETRAEERRLDLE